MQPLTPIDTEKSIHEVQYDRSVASSFKNISFGGSVDPITGVIQNDNVSGYWWSGTSAPSMTLTHNFGHPPYGYIVMSKSAPCDVYETSATDTTINLGASTTGVALKIFVLG